MNEVTQRASDVREVLMDAAFEIAAGNWSMAQATRFMRFIDAEAYTDAALMLVPDRYKDDYIFTSGSAYLGPDPMYYSEGAAQQIGFGDTLALAIAAASLPRERNKP